MPQDMCLELKIDNSRLKVEQAELSFRVETESWNEASGCLDYRKQPILLLSLELRFEDPKELGGPSGVELYLKLPNDTSASLKGQRLGDRPDDVEIWFNQEIFAVEENSFSLLSGIGAEKVELSWAVVGKDGVELKFAGLVDFLGLSIKAKSSADARSILARVWPALGADQLQLDGEVELDFVAESSDDAEPEDNTRTGKESWSEYYYLLKDA